MDSPSLGSGSDSTRGGNSSHVPGAMAIHEPFACTEATELPASIPGWDAEFAQLRPGPFTASGGIVKLGCASLLRFTIDQTLRHLGSPPCGSTAILVPGVGSGEAFALGRQLGLGQCITLPGGTCIDAITRDHYVDLVVAIDCNLWTQQLHWLDDCMLTSSRGANIETPGPHWITRMQSTLDWIFTALDAHPQAVARADVQGSISDQLLVALSDMGAPAGVEHYSRDARVHQRLAVERAREYIRAKLTEPLRLSELCRHARVRARSLEYGFREVTGLTPIAYVKTLRLNAVREALSGRSTRERSITEIALDQGFWHLSQFAVDYRKLFGETPSSTRKRTVARHSANSAIRRPS